LTINQKLALFPWNHRNLVSPEIMVIVLTPLVHAVCFLVDCRASSPQKLAHFEEHILTLHTEWAGMIVLVRVQVNWRGSEGVAAPAVPREKEG
jgi:hypothetical protein